MGGNAHDAAIRWEFRPETLIAVAAVKQALGLARPGVDAHGITVKDGRDLVTVRDVAVEDAIRRRVLDALGFPVVGEERGGEATADGAPYWLIDPICGTRSRSPSSAIHRRASCTSRSGAAAPGWRRTTPGTP